MNAAPAVPCAVSPLLIEALELALRAAELTDGDVDPTVGRALELAGYDRDWRLLAAPRTPSDDPGHRRSPRGVRAGWRSVTFDRATRTVRIPAGVAIDLGATAKAWAADRAARAAARRARLRRARRPRRGHRHLGPAPASGWQIRVTDDHRSDPGRRGRPSRSAPVALPPRAPPSGAGATTVTRCTTSSTLAQERPARNVWRTVSVAAADCAEANIATTAALMRAGTAPAWLAGLGLPARLVAQ